LDFKITFLRVSFRPCFLLLKNETHVLSVTSCALGLVVGDPSGLLIVTVLLLTDDLSCQRLVDGYAVSKKTLDNFTLDLWNALQCVSYRPLGNAAKPGSILDLAHMVHFGLAAYLFCDEKGKVEI
jgi:hypothetical protein